MKQNSATTTVMGNDEPVDEPSRQNLGLRQVKEMAMKDLIGVWTMISEEQVHRDGRITFPSGRERRGQLIYTADGFMAVVATDAGQGTRQATAAGPGAPAASGSVAYAGRFEVETDKVFHHVDVALDPDLVGLTRVRTIALEGGDLTLTTPTDDNGTFGRLRWRRV